MERGVLEMKALIIDLDEVLWTGKLLYDNVVLKEDSKELLRQVSKLKDVLLIACSKNDLPKATNKLCEFGLFEYFDSVHASWNPKSEMIKWIFEKYKLRKLECIFWDDEPVNRAEVKQIIGCHVDFDEDIFQVMKYFDTARLILMSETRARDKAENEFEGTYEEFLKDSNFLTQFAEAEEEDIPRILALTQRTNQLNATQERFDEDTIKRFLGSDNHLVCISFAEDKYCNYGLIGECILVFDEEKKGWIILDLCISCRVINKGIGSKMVDSIKCSTTGNLIGRLRETSKNPQMERLFKKNGFKEIKKEGDFRMFEWIR